MNAIEVNHVSKRFKEFTLDDVSFTLPRGYIMGLIGMNGAGKTTTIKLLLQMLRQDQGTFSLLGLDPTTQEHDIKQKIAVVFDDTFFVDSWKVSDVEPALSTFYEAWDSAQYQAYLTQFKLSKKKKIKQLSRGMRMKLMLAVALSHGAELLILDEPTNGLDPVARDELMDSLMRYVEDEHHSILFSTHILSDLEKIADYITVLSEGKVFFTGEKDALKEAYCIVKGGLEDVTEEFTQRVIGMKRYTTGFDALLATKDMAVVQGSMVCEELVLDDILVYLNRSQEEVLS